MNKQWINILIVGLAMGTAWAIRGQFGHEPGAAWAAGIGALALVLVSGRKDWYNKSVLIALSSALGWGSGGIISYGIVVGYGHGSDLLNATYGLEMLFVIGGLFGLLGGGLLGLTLESTPEKKVKWPALLAEMVAGGILVHSFLIDQLELLMTPPRSEAWAISLGAGLAMLWYMARHRFDSSMRVALFAALGGGFGFAFGNFLQILGNVLEIKFNMWNVMEYNIGFWGGSAMAYGVFTSRWPDHIGVPKKYEQNIAALLVLIFVPVIVFQSSDFYEILSNHEIKIDIVERITRLGALVPLALIFLLVWQCWSLIANGADIGRRRVKQIFIFYFGAYIIFSYCITGVFSGNFLLNHHLYVVNFLAILVLLWKPIPAAGEFSPVPFQDTKWLRLFGFIILFIFVLAFIAVHIHGEVNGAQVRFK